MEEQELLDCLSEDVSLGIELAIRQYGKAVKTICRSILSGYSGEDIEEAISDTFVGLWRSREKIKLTDGQGLREYLYGIARRTALNKRRTLAKEHPTQNIDTAEELVSGENVEEQIVSRSEYEILYPAFFLHKAALIFLLAASFPPAPAWAFSRWRFSARSRVRRTFFLIFLNVFAII